MGVKDRLYDVPVVGTALRMQDRYKADAADQLAAAIGFFGFLSLFPLMVIALAATGYLLRSDPGARDEVVAAITGSIPGFRATLEGPGGQGTSIETALETISRNAGTIGLVGIATLLVSGLRVVKAAMTATTRVFRVPLPQGVKAKVIQMGALALLGLLALAGAAAGTSVGISTSGVAAFVLSVLATLLSLALDLVLFLVAYRMLAARQGPTYRQLLPGALLAAVGWTALKVVGSSFVSSQAGDANALYGALGGVIGLLLLLYLAGRLYLYGAELSALLAGIGVPSRPAAHVVSGHVSASAAAGPGDGDGHGDEDGDEDERHGAEHGDRHDRGDPPPRPAAAAASLPHTGDPGPGAAAPSVGRGTRRRLEQADADRTGTREGPDVRGAIAFALALGVLGVLVRALRPWGADH